MLVAPRPAGGLAEAETSLVTPHGQVRVRWTLNGSSFTVEAELPEGVSGILRLPGYPDRPIGPGRTMARSEVAPPSDA